MFTTRRSMSAALLIPVLALALLTAACSSDDTSEASEGTTDTASKTLLVGSTLDLAPMEFLKEDGTETGFEIEVLEKVADRLGYTIEYVQTPFDQAFTGLQADKYRLNASGIFIRCSRVADTEGVGEFTVPFYEDGQVIAVKSDRVDEITSLEDLDGLTLGVESAGSTADAVADEANANNTFTKEIFPDQNSLILALEQGRIDAAMQSGSVMRYSIRDKDDIEVSGTIEKTVRPVGMLFRAGDELREEFNETLDELKGEGVISDIYTSWFNTAPDADSPVVAVVPEVTTDTCSE